MPINSDPSLVIHVATDKWISQYYFATLTNYQDNDYTNHINIVILATETGGLELDGVSVVTTWTTVGSSGYVGAQVSLTPGYHYIHHSTGVTFGAVIYGQRDKESYATCLYVALPSTMTDTSTVPVTTTIESTDTHTTVPDTSIAESITHETTIPETAVPETTVPEITLLEITLPRTTVPGTNSKLDFDGSKMDTDSHTGTISPGYSMDGLVTTEETTSKTMVSETGYQTRSWLYWSECSVTCGRGTQYRLSMNCQSNRTNSTYSKILYLFH